MGSCEKRERERERTYLYYIIIFISIQFHCETTLHEIPNPNSSMNIFRRAKRLSGLQKEVLNVYRDLLRVAKTKPKEPNFAHGHNQNQNANENENEMKHIPNSLYAEIRRRFRQDAASINVKDHRSVEWHVGEARNHLIKLKETKGEVKATVITIKRDWAQ